jgi:hypothetical protein
MQSSEIGSRKAAAVEIPGAKHVAAALLRFAGDDAATGIDFAGMEFQEAAARGIGAECGLKCEQGRDKEQGWFHNVMAYGYAYTS